MSKPMSRSFQARLERGASRLNWVIARIPFDVEKIWGTRAMLRVKGDINGYAFRTSLFPTGDGRHTLLVNKRMQAGAKAVAGDLARFHLEPDTEERIVSMPPEMELALSEARGLRRWFDRLNPSMRNEIARWITNVKSDDARERRAEQMAERLLETMEAERDLPPVLSVVFAGNARAREGWKRMSPARRRSHLLGIFYYRTPDARARRAAKAVQDACRIADSKANSTGSGKARP